MIPNLKKIPYFLLITYLVFLTNRLNAQTPIGTWQTYFNYAKAKQVLVLGNKIIKAGNWIKPPPPTMASIKPAKSEAIAIIIRIEISYWAKSSNKFMLAKIKKPTQI